MIYRVTTKKKCLNTKIKPNANDNNKYMNTNTTQSDDKMNYV